MPDFAVFSGQRTLAMVHNANVGVTATLRSNIQGPISNLFHTHSNL
jgi:hypothetical protein